MLRNTHQTTIENQPQATPLLGDLKFLTSRYTVSPSYFRELAANDPNFPKAVKMGRRFTRWNVSECDAYFLAAQKA